jgi:carbamoylphosphate synthase large subunit
MTTYTIRLVHDSEVRRLQFYGPEEGRSLVRALNERLDEVSALPLDAMVAWTIEEMQKQGFDHLDTVS